MASSRFKTREARASRLSSPQVAAVKDEPTSETGSQAQNGGSPSGERWTEPPLRTPAPSFEDYKGLERHGVLEHMAPLGSLPTQKVKLRVKGFDQSRRMTQPKNGEAPVKETVKTPDGAVATRRSESRKAEERTSKAVSLRQKDDDQDYNPKGASKSSTKSTTPRASLASTPSSRTAAGQERLKQVVDSAVERSYELGNPILGLAVRKLFEESLHNRTLADLLDAVLSQRPTPRQAADFQAYIKVARKQIKVEKSVERRSSTAGIGASSKSSSKSPSKTMRPSMTRQKSTGNDRSDGVSNLLPSKSTPQHDNTSKHKMATREEHPAKRRKRSKSVSSTSSLSSLSSIEPSMEIDSSNPAESNGKKPSGPKLQTFSTANFASASAKRGAGAGAESTEDLTSRRRRLQKDFDDYSVSESHIRTSPSPAQPGIVASDLPIAPIPLSLQPHQTRTRTGGTRSSTRRDEYEAPRSPASSAPGELLVPPPPGAQVSSRGHTPNQLGRPTKRFQKAARVKMSPIKKRAGVIAGIARTGSGRDSPIGYGHMDDNEEVRPQLTSPRNHPSHHPTTSCFPALLSFSIIRRFRVESVDVGDGWMANEDDQYDPDNVDYCTACGGNGQLLCCDGCPRSFHFTCLDPPMNSDHPPDGEWYCFICVSKKRTQPKRPRGLFAALFAGIDKQNPVAYNLPPEIRNYFEGVKTGEEGEYEEATTAKSRTRAGYDEVPDNYKLKDAKGNFVLCYRCGKSSLGHREIVGCDFCSLQWHLDCLDPPMANPPPRGNSGRPKHTWMCPNHIDEELQALDSSVRTSNRIQVNGGTHRVRRPKNARIVDTALRRGFRNNGLIEIEDDPDDAEEFEKEELGGVVYRVPARGIKLDFIDRVKRSWVVSETLPQQEKLTVRAKDEKKLQAAAAARARIEAFNKRSLADRQAALNLAQLAQSNTDLNISPDQVQSLVDTLIAEAPAEVLALCSKQGSKDSSPLGIDDPSIPPTPPESDLQDRGISAKERQSLLLIQELIRRRLGDGTSITES